MRRRRRRVEAWLAGHGRRRHASVFECRLDARRHSRLMAGLAERIDPRSDRVSVYPLCRRDLPDVLSVARDATPVDEGVLVV